jgi:hypothetical protein
MRCTDFGTVPCKPYIPGDATHCTLLQDLLDGMNYPDLTTPLRPILRRSNIRTDHLLRNMTTDNKGFCLERSKLQVIVEIEGLRNAYTPSASDVTKEP